MGKIHKYIFKETASPVLFGIFLFTLVVIIQQLVRISDYMITGGVPPSEILRLIIYSLPAFLSISVPVSLILGITIVFSRLSIDSEIIAMRATGLSIRQLLFPVFLISMIGFSFMSYLSLYGSSTGYNNLYSTLRRISFYGSREIIKEGVFTRLAPGTLVYVDHLSADEKTMKGVIISVKKNLDEPILITAEEGIRPESLREGKGLIQLNRGTMIQKIKSEDAHRMVTFGAMTLNSYLENRVKGASSRKPKEISVPEILQMLSSGQVARELIPSYLFSIHKRLALPFACIVFSLLAVPLGLAQKSRSKSASLLVTGAIVFLYYIFIGIAQSLKSFSPLLSIVIIWLPNVLFGIAAFFIIKKLDDDASLGERFRRHIWRKR